MGRRRSDRSMQDSEKRHTLASAFTPQRASNSAPAGRLPSSTDPWDDQYDADEHYDEGGEYGSYDGYAPDGDYASYGAQAGDLDGQDDFTVPPFVSLPTLPGIPAAPAQSSPRQPGWGHRSGIQGIEGLGLPGDDADGDNDYLPVSSNPRMSSPRLRAASNATPLSRLRPDGGQNGHTSMSGKQARQRHDDPRDSSGRLPARASGKHAQPRTAIAVMEQSQPTKAVARRKPSRSRSLIMLDTVFIPGRNLTRRLIPQPMRRHLARPTFRLFDFVQRRRVALIALLVLVLATGLLVNATGLANLAGTLSANAWRAFSGATPLPTPLTAPDTTDPGHYVAKYGFDWPSSPQPISGAEWNRLAFMLPYAIEGTNAADVQYHATIEPEMVVWWTHAEGIGGHINYSNCANEGTRSGTNYFTDIENCDHSSFWQLGYGNQFSVIYVLKDAFTDLYGNPNNPQLVQKVGQKVLDFDASQGTIPACGGYSCTFPAMTIGQIMSGINEDTGVMTADNWWASVLSRDPLINCFMIAYALEFFNHAATRNWVGCYYYEPCWGYESNSLGDILAAWPALRKAAGLPATPTGTSL